MPVKGSDFEREVCKALSMWWTNNTRDDVFWRSSQSGGRATVRAKTGRKTAGSYGDITALDAAGQPFLDRFCVEIKRGYGTWSIMDELDKGPRAAKQMFSLFWEQACASAAQSGPDVLPMVIFRKDKRRTCVAVHAHIISQIFVARRFSVPHLTWHDGCGLAIGLVLFDDFVCCVRPADISGRPADAAPMRRMLPPK